MHAQVGLVEVSVAGVEASGRGCASVPSFAAFHACIGREHRCLHAAIAGTSSCVPSSIRGRIGLPAGTVAGGDYLDPAASVNDPIFFVHHANLDRKLLAWQTRHVDASAPDAYPRQAPPGHRLGDVLGPRADPLRDGSGAPLTVGAVLATPVDYTYDTLEGGGGAAPGTLSSRAVDCLEGHMAQQCADAI